MPQRLALTSLIVRDYDEAIAFYTGALGFVLREDTPLLPEKRWVVVAPPGSDAGLLLARAASDAQHDAVGAQAGGRVFLFLETDDFTRDHAAFVARGVRFLEAPRRMPDRVPHRWVAVFEDLYGNRWDLIGPADAAREPPPSFATTAS